MIRRWLACCMLLLLSACGGGGGGGGSGGGSGNQAPVFTSSAAISVAENIAGAIYNAIASDPNGASVTYSISGGPDALRFTINASSGALNFAVPPDFELPADANGDNVYQLTLSASDGALSATLNLNVTVTNSAGAVGLHRVTTGFTQPLFLTTYDATRVIVLEKGGLARLMNVFTGAIATTPFLDVTTSISTAGEGGLLGIALAPDFITSRVFYVYVTNSGGTIEIRRYTTMAGSPDQADPASANVILTIPHPGQTNHYGGWIGFGPDNLLYIAAGDGGGAGDPDGNGQNVNTLLGAISRINPSSDAFPADPNRDYSIPAGNPFASGGGALEIWVYGLRNPFRNGFDRSMGDLMIGDVGQDAIEEIDRAQVGDGGTNYGWNLYEGTSVFTAGAPAFPGSTRRPIAQYSHGSGATQGDSIIGGYTYRGPIVSMRGQYFFADFINPRIWSLDVNTFSSASTISAAQFTDHTTAFAPDVGTISNITSFGEDFFGNLYVVTLGGSVYRMAESD